MKPEPELTSETNKKTTADGVFICINIQTHK